MARFRICKTTNRKSGGSMTKFIINCPDDLSAKIVKKVLKESFLPDFRRELIITEETEEEA